MHVPGDELMTSEKVAVSFGSRAHDGKQADAVFQCASSWSLDCNYRPTT